MAVLSSDPISMAIFCGELMQSFVTLAQAVNIGLIPTGLDVNGTVIYANPPAYVTAYSHYSSMDGFVETRDTYVLKSFHEKRNFGSLVTFFSFMGDDLESKGKNSEAGACFFRAAAWAVLDANSKGQAGMPYLTSVLVNLTATKDCWANLGWEEATRQIIDAEFSRVFRMFEVGARRKASDDLDALSNQLEELASDDLLDEHPRGSARWRGPRIEVVGMPRNANPTRHDSE